MNTKSFKKSRTFVSKPYPSMETPTHHLPLSRIIGEAIDHFSHPQHHLAHIWIPHIFTCMGCKEFGAGNRFRCEECQFDLHEFCALAPPSLKTHSLHTQHPLVFYTKPGGYLRSKCDICGKATKGYAFRCGTCNFVMHPSCAELSREKDFPVHPHTLKLVPTASLTNGDMDSACDLCKRKLSGRVYGCASCKYHLHAVCAKVMVNGLHDNGIKPPVKPSKFGRAVGLASHVIVGFIGGLVEGIGEGVGEALFTTIADKSKKKSDGHGASTNSNT